MAPNTKSRRGQRPGVDRSGMADPGGVNWWQEVVHSAVTIASVLIGGWLTTRAGERAADRRDRAEGEAETRRIRRTVLTDRLRSQNEAIAAYLKTIPTPPTSAPAGAAR